MAPRPTPAIRPSISSNLHLSKDLPPFEAPPLAALTGDVLAGCLQSAFGYGGFKGRQLEVVRRVLDGHSTLAVLPTGGLPQQLITGIFTMSTTIIIAVAAAAAAAAVVLIVIVITIVITIITIIIS